MNCRRLQALLGNLVPAQSADYFPNHVWQMIGKFTVREPGRADLHVFSGCSQPQTDYFALVFSQYLGKPPGLDVADSAGGTGQPFENLFHHALPICRFYQVIVHLLPYGFERRFECRISSENKCDSVRLRPAHSAYHRESISRLANIKVGDEHIECLRGDEL